MSRVGKMPVVILEGTTATIANNEITVKGPLGSMSRILSDLVTVKQEDKSLKVEAANDSREAVAMWGTTRALLNNMKNVSIWSASVFVRRLRVTN